MLHLCSVDGVTQFSLPIKENESDPGGGILTLPSGQTFRICGNCLDFLWQEKNPAYISQALILPGESGV